jgi:hypothetical protein
VSDPVVLVQDTNTYPCTCCVPPIARFRYDQCAGGRNGTSDMVNCPAPAMSDPISWDPNPVNLDASCSQWDGAGLCADVQFMWDFENDATWDLTTAAPVIPYTFPTGGLPTVVRLRVNCPTMAESHETTLSIGLNGFYCNGCPTGGVEPNPNPAVPDPVCVGDPVSLSCVPSGGTPPYTF